LELEDTLADHCNTIVSQKSSNTQGVEETIMEKLVKLQQQIDSFEISKQCLKVLVITNELRCYIISF
jgi:hypothetical protein